MEDAEANAVFKKLGAGLAIEGEGDAARFVADDFTAPEEIEVSLAAVGLEGKMERFFAGFDLHASQTESDGFPLMIPDRAVDRTHDFVIAKPDVAKEGDVWLKLGSKRAGAQRDDSRARSSIGEERLWCRNHYQKAM